MKRKSASNYEKQVLVENALGILFSLALTIMLIMNLDSIIEFGNSLSTLH